MAQGFISNIPDGGFEAVMMPALHELSGAGRPAAQAGAEAAAPAPGGPALKAGRGDAFSSIPKDVRPPGLLAWEAYFLVWCAGIWSLREPGAACAAAAFLWGGLVFFRRPGCVRSLCSLALVLLCLFGGAAAGRRALPPVSPPLAAFCGREAAPESEVRGRVAEVQDKAAGRMEILLADATASVEGGGVVRIPGLLALGWDDPDYRPAPGQAVAIRTRVRPVRGFLNAGLSDFSWRERLRDVFYRAYGRGSNLRARWGPRPAVFWWDAREHLRAAFLRRLPAGQGAAIVLGLVLGERSRIDFAVSDELRAAGLAHTLALSGLNVVYVAALGWALAWLAGVLCPRLYLRIPRAKLAVLLGFPLVAAYVWIGQASPSLVRSALMFGFWGLLLLFDRGRALTDGLFWALLVIVLREPLAVYDLSLQLSAVAVAGLAFLYPWLRGMLPRGRGRLAHAAYWCWDGFCLSLAANIAILPVSVWCFGTFPPDFLLNLPWLPVQGFAVQVPGMIGLALAPIPGLGAPAGWLLSAAACVQDWMLAALHRGMAAGLFPTWVLLRPFWPELLGAAVVSAVAPFVLSRRSRGFSSAGAALLLVGLFCVAWPQVLMLRGEARQEARLTLLDVGQAQAALIDLPGGRRILVDAGGTFSPTFDIGRSVVGPALSWGRPPRLDCVLFSHPDLDHAQGLAWILRHFEVKRFCTNGQWPEGRLGRELAADVAAGAPAPEALHAGETLVLGRDARLEVANPSQDSPERGTNDNSLVLRLVWRGRPLCVLPGDIEWRAIEDMLDRGGDLRADLLVLPHHGAKSSLSGMLYAAVAPRLAFASCGFQNRYRFPNKDVAGELALRRIPLLSTAQCGMLAATWSAKTSEPAVRGFPGRAGSYSRGAAAVGARNFAACRGGSGRAKR